MTDPEADVPRWLPVRRDPSWRALGRGGAGGAARAFHQSLPGYAATPLHELASLAADLGVGRVFAKDESSRLGLPAFKALGASWAVARVCAQLPDGIRGTMVTATDGNHGRAVARFARVAGQDASVFVPDGVSEVAVAAIVAEGARVTRVDGDYDAAVEQARVEAERDHEHGARLVQDMGWAGYEQVPGWIVDGYGTLFEEIDEELAERGVRGGPDLVLVPVGVGSLAQAAVAHYRSPRRDGRRDTAIVAVEPQTAACLQASLAAGQPETIETGTTIMAGLNCASVSQLAWPLLRHGLDGAVTVSDLEAAAAARDLAALGVPAGPCGAAGLGGIRALVGEGTDAQVSTRREHLHLDSDAIVVLLVTEGAEANPLGSAS